MAREIRARVAACAPAVALLAAGCSGGPVPEPPPAAAATSPAAPSASPAAPASPTPPPKPRRLDGKGLTRALDRYLSRRASEASLVMMDRTTGITYRYRPTHEYVTASVVKVDILAALLLRLQRAHRKPTAAERADAGIMIRYSDNEAADRLYTRVGGAAGVDAANRRLELRHTRAVDGRCIDLLCWSLTRTTADDQVRLLRELAGGRGPLTAANRAYVLGLMGRVTSEQSWGVRAAARHGDEVANKNGWMTHEADGDRWAINSIGRVRGHGHDFLIAVFSAHNPSEGYGITTVEHMVAMAAQRFRATTPWLD
ncbi:MAG TPA: serine hydrolase [Streptosporangiaceae bacterium]